MGEGQKCGAFGAIAASLIPSLIGPIAKLFGGKKRIKGKRKKTIKYNRNIKMTWCRNNILMVKRQTPKRVESPNGRVFYAKYKRVDKNGLPASIRIRKT